MGKFSSLPQRAAVSLNFPFVFCLFALIIAREQKVVESMQHSIKEVRNIMYWMSNKRRKEEDLAFVLY